MRLWVYVCFSMSCLHDSGAQKFKITCGDNVWLYEIGARLMLIIIIILMPDNLNSLNIHLSCEHAWCIFLAIRSCSDVSTFLRKINGIGE